MFAWGIHGEVLSTVVEPLIQASDCGKRCPCSGRCHRLLIAVMMWHLMMAGPLSAQSTSWCAYLGQAGDTAAVVSGAWSMTECASKPRANASYIGASASSTWDLQNSSRCFEAPESGITLRCLQLSNVVLQPPSSTSFLQLAAFGSSSTPFVLQGITLNTDCVTLLQQQQHVCNTLVAYGTAQMQPGWLHVKTWNSPLVKAKDVNLTCSATDIAFLPMPPCALTNVTSLSDILNKTSTLSIESLPLRLTLTSNISFAGTAWPQQGIVVASNVTFVGIDGATTVLDFQGCGQVMNITDTGFVTVVGLTIINENIMYLSGNYNFSFNYNAIASQLMWSFSRTSRRLWVWNSIVVCPADELDYFGYWLTHVNSPVARLYRRAWWLRAKDPVTGPGIDSEPSSFTYVSLDGEATAFRNVLLTPQPPAGFRLNMRNTGITKFSAVVEDGLNYLPLPALAYVRSVADVNQTLEQYSPRNASAAMVFTRSVVFNRTSWGSPRPVDFPFLIRGHPYLPGPIVVDISQVAAFLLVTGGGSITLADLTIMNLAVPAGSYDGVDYESYASGFWMFQALDGANGGANSSDNAIMLSNVTVVLQQDELNIMLAGIAQSAQPAVSTRVAAFMQQWSQGSRVSFFNSTHLRMSTLFMPRTKGINVLFTSRAPTGFILLPTYSNFGAPPSPPASPSPSSSTSKRAIAIAVPVAVIGTALLALAAWLLVARRRKQHKGKDPGGGLVSRPLGGDSSGDEEEAVSIAETSMVVGGSACGARQSSNKGAGNSSSQQTAVLASRLTYGDSNPSGGVTGIGSSGSRPKPASVNANPHQEIQHMIQGLNAEMNEKQVTVTEFLGSGAYGVVYKGIWRGLQVAVKTLLVQGYSANESWRHRAMMETAISANLSHPNVVATYTFDIKPLACQGAFLEELAPTGWKIFLVQELCDGGPLKTAVDSGLFFHPVTKQPLMARMVDAALQMAQGVQHLHRRNIVHGDLNPNNVLLKSDSKTILGYRVKLADFGLSIKMDNDQTHVSDMRQGTPHYVAPEVLQRGQLGKPADTFAFGVLLWELYCGTPLWRRQGRPDVPAYEAHVQLKFPLGCPIKYVQLCHSCLAPDPLLRPTLDDVFLQLKILEDSLSLGLEDTSAVVLEVSGSGDMLDTGNSSGGHAADTAIAVAGGSAGGRSGEVAQPAVPALSLSSNPGALPIGSVSTSMSGVGGRRSGSASAGRLSGFAGGWTIGMANTRPSGGMSGNASTGAASGPASSCTASGSYSRSLYGGNSILSRARQLMELADLKSADGNGDSEGSQPVSQRPNYMER